MPYLFIYFKPHKLLVSMDDMRIFKSEGWYVAEIPSLHVVTRAKTMVSLKRNIKEAIDLAVESMMALKSMKISAVQKKMAYA